MRYWKNFFNLLLIFVLLTGIAKSQDNASCFTCHSDSSLTKRTSTGKELSLFVNQKNYENSVHGSFECVSCHQDIKEIPHPEKLQKVDCASCHPDAGEKYRQGVHGIALAKGNRNSPNCASCHTAHSILPASNPKSATAHKNIPDLCGKCHGDLKFVEEQTGIISARPFFNYKESVHGKALQKGDQKAAVCSDCHQSHDIKPPSDPSSTIFKSNVPFTCAQCHQAISEEYLVSIHGQALKAGLSKSPVCTDCHGIHTIKAKIDPKSSIATQALARTTCIQCHESEGLSNEYGVAGKRISTYLDSYHGLAMRFGSKVVANCASCHGIHNIFPSTDPRSLVNPSNLANTCGKCHPGASENFARGKIHVLIAQAQDVGTKVVKWVTILYIFLIIIVIGGMLVHNFLDWIRSVWGTWRKKEPEVYLKLTGFQRIQHAVLFTSFFALALTGFALKYPESFHLLFGSDENLRRILHRIFAVIFIADSLVHIGFVLFSAVGKNFILSLFPQKRDLKQLLWNLKFYFGLVKTKAPEYPYGYVEKAEYWALVWGGVIMSVTGIMLWYKNIFLGFLPKWSMDVVTVIHFYEAILATSAIFIWHFYAVIFKPGIYPMNWAWLTGKAKKEEFEIEPETKAKKD